MAARDQARIDCLQQLLDQGLYPAQAARSMGITKNAACGLINRHKLRVTNQGHNEHGRGEWARAPLITVGGASDHLRRLMKDRTKAKLERIPTPEEIASRFLDSRRACA